MGKPITDYVDSVVDAVIPGGSIITGAITAVGKWLSIKGKTPEKPWQDVRSLFDTYFNAVYDTYFSENYTWKPIDLERGSFDLFAPGKKGIWSVGMVLFDKKTNADKGIVAWGRYGTMENKIGNGGVGDPVGRNVTKDAGRGFPSATELFPYIKSVYKLNSGITNQVEVPTQGEPIPEKEKNGIPVDVKFSVASFGPYVQYILIGVVIVAMIFMFKKK